MEHLTHKTDGSVREEIQNFMIPLHQGDQTGHAVTVVMVHTPEELERVRSSPRFIFPPDRGGLACLTTGDEGVVEVAETALRARSLIVLGVPLKEKGRGASTIYEGLLHGIAALRPSADSEQMIGQLPPGLFTLYATIAAQMVALFEKNFQAAATIEPDHQFFKVTPDGSPIRITEDGKEEVAMWPSHIDRRRAASAQIQHGYYQPLIRAVLLKNGFRIKEGKDDLDDYVYGAVSSVIGAVFNTDGNAIRLSCTDRANQLLKVVVASGPVLMADIENLEDAESLVRSNLATRIWTNSGFKLAATPLVRNYLKTLDT